MTTVRVGAVQATYELMDREATIDRAAEITARDRRARPGLSTHSPHRPRAPRLDEVMNVRREL